MKSLWRQKEKIKNSICTKCTKEVGLFLLPGCIFLFNSWKNGRCTIFLLKTIDIL